MINKPYIINFPKIGSDTTGFISVCEKQNLPFKTKRVYWTYYTNPEVVRGACSYKFRSNFNIYTRNYRYFYRK